jgi:hypothetical protein
MTHTHGTHAHTHTGGVVLVVVNLSKDQAFRLRVAVDGMPAPTHELYLLTADALDSKVRVCVCVCLCVFGVRSVRESVRDCPPKLGWVGRNGVTADDLFFHQRGALTHTVHTHTRAQSCRR